MNNEMIIARAKRIVHSLYKKSCSYQTIGRTCAPYNHVSRDGVLVTAGSFRSTIIAGDIAIKTGMNYSGKVQCRKEAQNYIKAKQAGLHWCFAQCYGMFTYRKHEFYVFEAVDLSRNEIFNRDGYYFEDITVDLEGYDDIYDFLNKNHINDLHSENFGFDEEGFPIIYDYAGFDIIHDKRV